MKTKQNAIVGWVCLALSSTLFTGFLPGRITGKPGKGGGTAGAAVALACQFLLFSAPIEVLVALMIGSFFLGWIVCGPGERLMLERWGSRRRHTGELVTGDFNETCIDEFHGQLLAGLPFWIWTDGVAWRILGLIASFVLFRVFDKRKPWPINAVENRFKGTAFGIMIDDTVAGAIPAALVTIFILVSLVTSH